MKLQLDTKTFAETCRERGPGDIIEFGTREGDSTVVIAEEYKLGNIFTIDGFEGLPGTAHGTLPNNVWREGNFKADKDTVIKRLSQFPNVNVIASWISDLKNPSEYGIKKIVGANVDVDIYESTLESLIYLDKCEWDEVVLRFDDWDYHTMQDEVKKHNQAAFTDYIRMHNFYDEEKKYTYELLYYGTIIENGAPINNAYPYFATFLLKRN
jgi:hypothetical protein